MKDKYGETRDLEDEHDAFSMYKKIRAKRLYGKRTFSMLVNFISKNIPNEQEILEAWPMYGQ